MKKIVVGITGASGSIYAKRMIEVLASQDINVHVVATDTGKKVFAFEIGIKLKSWILELQKTYPHVNLKIIKIYLLALLVVHMDLMQ